MTFNSNLTKPFIKWVGGKSEILNDVLNKYPTTINNYYEFFLGGGSVLFGLLNLVEQKKIIIKGNIYAYDYNEHLINVYKHIQNKPYELSKGIDNCMEYYNDTDDKQKIYYWLRNIYNNSKSGSINKSALFIILNKLCFRGLHRENKKGEFNVSYGNYKNPLIPDLQTILNISMTIQNVIFNHNSFVDVINKPNNGDYVYLDPPYFPINNDFVNYTSSGFNKEHHKILFRAIKQFKKKKIKFLMSNSDSEILCNNFLNYPIQRIVVSRRINSKKPNSKVYEVLISNKQY